MDDEEILRESIGKMILSLGYEVDLATEGSEAIKSFMKTREEGNSYDVIILDLTVPGGMGGKKAIKRLTEIDPQVKVIISSGYPNDPTMVDFREYGFSGVIAKPYRIKELSETLHSVVKAYPK